jgi:hypothetical protein
VRLGTLRATVRRSIKDDILCPTPDDRHRAGQFLCVHTKALVNVTGRMKGLHEDYTVGSMIPTLVVCSRSLTYATAGVARNDGRQGTEEQKTMDARFCGGKNGFVRHL